MPEAVPAELRGFILRYIDSIGALETLLIMRAAPSTSWTAASLAPRLYTTLDEAHAFLVRLAEDGFLIQEQDGFRFECVTEGLRRSVDALAEYYARHIIPVTNLIHSKPRRIREFADAFKLKKDR